MSIILGTLDRLEAENPSLGDSVRQNLSPRLAVKPGGLPGKRLALAAIVTVSGAMLGWSQQSDHVAGFRPPPAVITNDLAVPGNIERELSPLAIQALPVLADGPDESDYMTSSEQGAIPVAEQIATPSQEVMAPPASQGPAISAPATNRSSARPGPYTADEARAVAVEPGPEHIDPVEMAGAANGGNGAALAPVAGSQVAMVETHEDPHSLPAEPYHSELDAYVATVQSYRIDKVIEQARLALSRGLYQRAVYALEALEPIPADRAEYWLIKGSACLGLGQLDLAEAAFSQAQVLAPENVQIGVQQAILQQEKGDHPAAVRILGDLAVRYPEVPEIFLNLGYSQQALGAERQARRSYRAFLEMTQNRSLYAEQRRAVSEWLAQGGAEKI